MGLADIVDCMAQSLAEINLHLVFSTKHRVPSITPEIEARLFAFVASILNEKCGCPARIVGGHRDHLHTLFSLSRTITVSDVVKTVKANSSRWMKTHGGDFTDFSWQNGYGIFSVSSSLVPTVVNYIENQHEHHRTRTFQDEFRVLLERHGVEFDERYVWD